MRFAALIALTVMCSLTLGLTPASVVAQQRVPDGRGHDANQRVGSGGVNESQPQPDFRSRNDVVTGNVGAGRAFQGDIDYRAPGEFRDQLGSDDLFRFRAQSYASGLNQLNAVQAQRGYAIGDGTTIYRSFTPLSATNRISTQLVPNNVSVGGYTHYSEFADGPLTVDMLDRGGAWTDDRLGILAPSQTGRILEAPLSPLLGIRAREYRDSQGPLEIELQRQPDEATAPDGDDTTGPRDSDAEQADDLDPSEVEGRLDLRQGQRQSTAIDGRAYQLSAGVGTTEQYARQSARLAPSLVLGHQLDSRVLTERADIGDQVTQQRLRQLEAQLLSDRQPEPGQGVYADLLAAVRDNEGQQAIPEDQLMADNEQDQQGEPQLDGLETPAQRELEVAERGREQVRQRWAEQNAQNADQNAAGAQPGQAENATLQSLLQKLNYELPRLTSLAGDQQGQANQLMTQAERDLTAANYFDAEGRYRQVLQASPNEPLARVGLVHAQLGAGLLRSAGIHLRGVLADHPELIAAKYNERLLPDGERMQEVQEALQNMIRQGEGGAGNAALLLAYLGYQGASDELIRYGLATAEIANPRDPLLPLLRTIWLDERPIEQQPAPAKP